MIIDINVNESTVDHNSCSKCWIQYIIKDEMIKHIYVYHRQKSKVNDKLQWSNEKKVNINDRRYKCK